MIPVLQFDPASMTLWYDSHLLSQARGFRSLELALDGAIAGDDRILREVVACTNDPWVQTRAANIASAVWHEKRHFLDFALTNYGALRLRSLFEVYLNLKPILKLHEKGRLLVPLDSNLDPIMRKIMDIGDLPDEVMTIARNVQKRKLIFQADSQLIASNSGDIQIGGEALLEGIAYHVQMGKTHRVFGPKMVERVQHDQPGIRVVDPKYKWAYDFLYRADLLKFDFLEPNHIAIHDGPFIPICYAALAGRFWGQKQVKTSKVSSYLPGERLVSLVHDLHTSHPQIADCDALNAWEIANNACLRLFGRTAIDEMRIDIEHESRFVEQISHGAQDSHLVRAIADLHQLRERLFGLLNDDPHAILDQARWADETANRTQPFVIAAAPGGEAGRPPASHTMLSGYSEPVVDANAPSGQQWWWNAMNLNWPPSSDDFYQLQARESWVYVASEYAPLGKLLYAGNSMRVMLGNELFAARVRFQHATGFKLIVDPAFAWPEHVHDISFWYFITGRDNFRCDLSGEKVQQPEGVMLDPWALRLRPKLVELLLGTVAEENDMRLTLVRDWSPWLLSDEFREFFESFEPNESNLARLLGDG